MEDRLFYPAIFHVEEEGGYWVSFPDIPEALTGGDNMAEAYKMAIDCLGLALTVKEDEKESFPTPSSPDKIKLEDGEFLIIVEFDRLAYRKRTNSRAVKKTLSIPEWLNEEAMDKGINFSQVLQEALIAKLKTF